MLPMSGERGKMKKLLCPKCGAKLDTVFAGNALREWKRVKRLWIAGGGGEYKMVLQCKRDTCRKKHVFSGKGKSDVMCNIRKSFRA